MSDETGRMSEEDKFLGVKNTIEPPEDTPASAQAGDIDVEIVDDRPAADRRPTAGATGGEDDVATDEEIESYGKRAYKRMKKLKWQYHEERRAKEQQERLANEAVTYTTSLQTENQRLLKLVQDSQKALNELSKYGAQIAVQAAQKNLKEAYETGDAEGVAKAQQALTEAQLTQASAPNVSQRVIDNWKQNVMAEERQVQQQGPAAQPNVPDPDPAAREWQESNPWFGQDTEMTSFAYGVHERLVRDEGVDPQSPEYYQLIDNRMKEVFPSYFGTNNQSSSEPVVVEAATRRRTSPVVAPATRNNGAAPRKVTLTSTQVALAERLGLTPQQYAAQLIKEMA